ncbi:MAG: zf-HC2 domain-containing protein [Gemmatimonadaceae bacterium]|nr:zf-HC2 domain-containing protein [Gemmatimonadaceae bacterium]
MTDCPDGAVRDLLPELVNDRLAPDVRRRVDAHVRDCADCQQEVELLRALRASLRRVSVMDVGTIVSAIPAYRAPRRSWGGWRAAAAIMLLAVGGTSVAVLQRENTAARDGGVSAVAPSGRGTSPIAQPSRAPTLPAIQHPAPELALGNPAIDELNDRELATLLAELETLEAFPSPDEDRSADLVVPSPAGTD